MPWILVVAFVPETGSSFDRLKQTHVQLSLKHCAYWLSLREQPGYSGKAKDPRATLQLHKRQVFDIPNLSAIMDRIANGGLP